MKLVSVIVPVYNVKNYIEKCINSIINQTYRNLEIILVDDGSKDGSGVICDIYSKKDSRIKVVHKKNKGLSSARNVGLKNSHGNFCLFVDGDDYISPTMVKTMVKKIGNSDLIICNYKKVEKNGKEWYQQDQKIINDKNISYKQFWKLFYDGGNSVVLTVTWNKLYRRNIFRNLEFPIGKIHEDEFIIENIVERCKEIKLIHDTLYYYVQRVDSIMNSPKKNSNSEYDLIDAWLYRYDEYNKYKKINHEYCLKLLMMIIKQLIINCFSVKEKEKFYKYRKKIISICLKERNWKLIVKSFFLFMPNTMRLIYEKTGRA